MGVFQLVRLTARSSALVALAVAALPLALAAPAAAAMHPASSRPSATLKFRYNRIGDTSKPLAEWTVKGTLPRGYVIDLQRQFGTAHVWKTVERLHSRSGAEHAPSVALGRYAYKVHVRVGGRTIVNSRSVQLYSYGRVSLQNLCTDFDAGDPGVAVNGGDGDDCSVNTVQVGSTVFPYRLEDEGGAEPPEYDQVIIFPATSCRSISVQWALDNGAGSSDTASVEVVQANADPQPASTRYGQVGGKTFSLTGASWDLDNWVSGPDNEYLNATLSCYSTSGLR
jgi:hypothetical protein